LLLQIGQDVIVSGIVSYCKYTKRDEEGERCEPSELCELGNRCNKGEPFVLISPFPELAEGRGAELH
jgi:hypothetical protein